jgi:NADPH-dependent 2,4-dienoyl-CoA reductase/sulfur reductase-like enzyme
VGRIPDPIIAEEILEAGKADFIAMSRSLIADPNWANKAVDARFEDITPCIYCNECLARTLELQPVTCVVNPTVGKTKQMALLPADRKKKVIVAGGGPAGMEAARVSALRGHDVVLYEKADRLGGQFNLATLPPGKQELAKVIRYLEVQIEKSGAETRLGSELTSELVDELRPDVVVVATGAVPLLPDIPGADGPRVVFAHDVLAGKVVLYKLDEENLRHIGNRVVIIGGGLVGAETADYVRERGALSITLVEMLPEIASDMPIWCRQFLEERLNAGKVDFVTSAQVKEILEDGVVFVKDGKEETIRGIDNIVLATGSRPVRSLSAMIRDKVAEVHVIGDAKEPRKALEAIAEGARVGRVI